MTVALELARRINALRYESLPPEAVQWAKVGILDTVGVTLAGSNDPSATILAAALACGSGPSLVFGTAARRVNPLDAALVNGTASHALDFDDCNNTLGGHPSAPILPALFALADEAGAGGREFIAAYVAGFETECKMSMGVNFYQYTHGWHPTATIGVFGATAACAHLMHLSEGETATALAIAASLAAGVKSNFGTMVKPLHVGHCARSGLLAARLAKNGYTASPVAFEHKQGYFEVFNGAGNYDAARIFASWADPLDIVQPGIAIKQYPCCGSTHPAIDAMLELVRKHDLKAEAVERIESWTHARRLEHTNRPDPQSQKDAKFSVQYCLARALIDRKVVIEHFEGEAFRDAAVRELMTRIRVAPYTSAQFPESNHFGAEVKVTLRGGSALAAKVERAAGRTSANPLSPAQLKAKFDNCAARVLADARVASLYDAIEGFEKLADMRALGRIMTGEREAPPAAAIVHA